VDNYLDSDLGNELIYSKGVLEFVTVSGEYCGFLEKSDNYSKHEFFNKSLKLLPLLYLKAVLLPKIDTLTDSFAEKFVTEYDWNLIKQRIATKLGNYDGFVEISDLQAPNLLENSSFSISECFSDVYQELKDFISIYQLGSTDSMEEALWECSQNFQQSWGQKVLAIVSNFHQIVFGADEIEEDSDEEDNLQTIDNKQNSWVDNFFQKREEADFFDY